MATQFPWDKVKAETLRSLCKDLGLSSRQRVKREYMVQFLEEAEKAGLEAAQEYVDKNPPPEPEKRADESSNRRPKRSREVEPTIMESVGKRRRQEPAAGRPPARRAAANGKKAPVGAAKKAQLSTGVQTKARRGRPRKQKAPEENEDEAGVAEGSGVVSENGVGPDGEQDADGEMDNGDAANEEAQEEDGAVTSVSAVVVSEIVVTETV